MIGSNFCCGWRSGKAELDAAAKVATTLLPFYERFFNMPYPLAKLDLVGTCFASVSIM